MIKKAALYILLGVFFTSCYQNTENTEDPIIGTWALVDIIKNGISIVTDCEKRSTFEFNSANTIIAKSHEKINNTCLPEISYSTWAFDYGNSYQANGRHTPVTFVLDDTENFITITHVDAETRLIIILKKM